MEPSGMNEDGYFIDDFLGQAANEGTKARSAIANGDYNSAWGHYQVMSQHYLKHANKCGFTTAQTLALVGSVHRGMAKLLKLEERHLDALTHILYSVGCSKGALNKELKEYRPYFNRCKLRNVELEEVTRQLRTWKKDPDFTHIRECVAEWRDRSHASE